MIANIKKRMSPKDLTLNACIVVISLVMLFPLIWIIITSMKSQIDILKDPLSLVPNFQQFVENFKEVWRRADWLTHYKNTIVLTASIWAIQMLVAIPAGYAFGILKFKGQNLLFLLVLARMVVTPESTMLVNYLTVVNLGAYDTMVGVILPYVVSAQAIFMFRQAFKQIPPALRESAKLDGAGELRYMAQIAVPLISPYIISFSIITCVFQWNAFFWPMLVTMSKEKRILPVALAFFGLQAESGSEWGLTMVAALLVITPLLILFAIFQKKFINSFVSSGIK